MCKNALLELFYACQTWDYRSPIMLQNQLPPLHFNNITTTFTKMLEKIITILSCKATKKEKKSKERNNKSAITKVLASWIDVFGEAGVTYYIHMVGRGHMTSFLRRYRCLYPLSQQGWEGLNNKVTKYFHRCTQRGGRNSNGASA